jgi:endonuclease/exonuclease/phosphatase family metal-dependent hydrolase
MKLISLNIQGNKNWDRVLSFLNKQQADVICLQEVYQHQQNELESKLNLKTSFVPICQDYSPQDEFIGVKGTLIGTKLKVESFDQACYAGQAQLPKHVLGTCIPQKVNRCLITAKLTKEEKTFRIVTTHFTWAADGKTSPLQKKDLQKFKKELDRWDQFVLCGDFNNPRGEHVYNQLASWYQDEIPADVTTTIDPELHRAAPLELVVDGLFTTDAYQVDNVRIKQGVSDHKAIVAEISPKAD